MATSLLCVTGCNLKKTRVFKKLAAEQEQKSAQYTTESLQKSPDLRELDELCTKKIPIYKGFALRGKSASTPKSTFLTYSYDSGADERQVKSFYIDYFARSGWRLTEEKDGGWGPRKVGFRKDRYRIVIYYGAMDDVEYSLHCEKLSESGEKLPNKDLKAVTSNK